MRRPVRPWSALTLSVLLVLTAALAIRPQPAAAAEGDKRPNLQMLKLHDWRIETVNGRRLLRFTTIFVNAGPGHFELRGSRDPGDGRMTIRQRMFRWDGSSRLIKTPAIAKYSGDGHDHWHVQGVMTYEAWKLSDATGTARRGAKTGFCFFDTTPWNFSLRGARNFSYYREAWCGTQGALTNRTGLSVGWGDRYPWNFAFQWIDITGLPGGTYQVRATVDIQDFYDERIETDNCVGTRIRIPAPGSSAGPTVEANGSGCGVSAVTAVTHFPDGDTWNPPMHARIQPGTYTGYRFNSRGTVLRSNRESVSSERVVTVSARGIPPGTGHRYLYMTSGPFEGYWVRPTDGITLEP